MNTSPPLSHTLTWRSFENISSGSEAACAAAYCAFSLSSLEFASIPGSAIFAVTERVQPEMWRWAVTGPSGFLLEEGFQPTKEDAKIAAAAVLESAQASGLD